MRKSVPESRRATTFKAGQSRRPLAMLRAIAASIFDGGASFQRQILNGLQDRDVYARQATETPEKRAKVAKRRARNKAARRSRRVNRIVAKR